MTNFATEVFEALVAGILLSAVVAVIAQNYPKAAVAIGLTWAFFGAVLAIYEFSSWLKHASTKRVIPFCVGAVHAAFGLAIAFATTEGLIALFVIASVFDGLTGAIGGVFRSWRKG